MEYFLALQYYFDKNGKEIIATDLSDFFENGRSFPLLVSMLFKIDRIPKTVIKPFNIFQKNQNNDIAYNYLRENSDFSFFDIDLSNDKSQQSLISIILRKMIFNIDKSAIVAKCNEIVSPDAFSLSSISSFNKLIQVIVNKGFNGDGCNKFDVLEALFSSNSIPLILKSSSFSLEDVLLAQLSIIFDKFNLTTELGKKPPSDENELSSKSEKTTSESKISLQPNLLSAPKAKSIRKFMPKLQKLDNKELTDKETTNKESINEKDIDKEFGIDLGESYFNDYENAKNKEIEENKEEESEQETAESFDLVVDDSSEDLIQIPEHLSNRNEEYSPSDETDESEEAEDKIETKMLENDDGIESSLNNEIYGKIPEKRVKEEEEKETENEKDLLDSSGNLAPSQEFLHRLNHISPKLTKNDKKTQILLPTEELETEEFRQSKERISLSSFKRDFTDDDDDNEENGENVPYLFVVNYFLKKKHQKIYEINEINNGKSLPTLASVITNETIPDIVEDPDYSEKGINNVKTLHVLRKYDQNFWDKRFNFEDEKDQNMFFKMLFSIVFTKDNEKHLITESNEVLSEYGKSVNNMSNDWKSFEMLIILLHHLTDGKVKYSSDLEYSYENVKKSIKTAGMTLFICKKFEKIPMMFQVQEILDKIYNRETNFSSMFANNFEIMKHRCDENDEEDTLGSGPLLRTINGIGKSAHLHFNKIDDIIDGILLPELIKFMFKINEIPNVKPTSEIRNENDKYDNLMNIIKFLGNEVEQFRYLAFDFKDENLKDSSIHNFAQQFLNFFFVKSDSAKMIENCNKLIGNNIQIYNLGSDFQDGHAFLRLLYILKKDRKGFRVDKDEIYEFDYIKGAFQETNIPLIFDEKTFIKPSENYIKYQLQFIFNGLENATVTSRIVQAMLLTINQYRKIIQHPLLRRIGYRKEITIEELKEKTRDKNITFRKSLNMNEGKVYPKVNFRETQPIPSNLFQPNYGEQTNNEAADDKIDNELNSELDNNVIRKPVSKFVKRFSPSPISRPISKKYGKISETIIKTETKSTEFIDEFHNNVKQISSKLWEIPESTSSWWIGIFNTGKKLDQSLWKKEYKSNLVSHDTKGRLAFDQHIVDVPYVLYTYDESHDTWIFNKGEWEKIKERKRKETSKDQNMIFALFSDSDDRAANFLYEKLSLTKPKGNDQMTQCFVNAYYCGSMKRLCERFKIDNRGYDEATLIILNIRKVNEIQSPNKENIIIKLETALCSSMNLIATSICPERLKDQCNHINKIMEISNDCNPKSANLPEMVYCILADKYFNNNHKSELFTNIQIHLLKEKTHIIDVNLNDVSNSKALFEVFDKTCYPMEKFDKELPMAASMASKISNGVISLYDFDYFAFKGEHSQLKNNLMNGKTIAKNILLPLLEQVQKQYPEIPEPFVEFIIFLKKYLISHLEMANSNDIFLNKIAEESINELYKAVAGGKHKLIKQKLEEIRLQNLDKIKKILITIKTG